MLPAALARTPRLSRCRRCRTRPSRAGWRRGSTPPAPRRSLAGSGRMSRVRRRPVESPSRRRRRRDRPRPRATAGPSAAPIRMCRCSADAPPAALRYCSAMPLPGVTKIDAWAAPGIQRLPDHEAGFRPRRDVLHRRHARDDRSVARQRLVDEMKCVCRAPDVGAGAGHRVDAVGERGAPRQPDAADIRRDPGRRQRAAVGAPGLPTPLDRDRLRRSAAASLAIDTLDRTRAGVRRMKHELHRTVRARVRASARRSAAGVQLNSPLADPSSDTVPTRSAALPELVTVIVLRRAHGADRLRAELDVRRRNRDRRRSRRAGFDGEHAAAVRHRDERRAHPEQLIHAHVRGSILRKIPVCRRRRCSRTRRPRSRRKSCRAASDRSRGRARAPPAAPSHPRRSRRSMSRRRRSS